MARLIDGWHDVFNIRIHTERGRVTEIMDTQGREVVFCYRTRKQYGDEYEPVETVGVTSHAVYTRMTRAKERYQVRVKDTGEIIYPVSRTEEEKESEGEVEDVQSL